MSAPLADLPRPAAVVFDLDGTLVDTVETRIRAWLDVFAEERIPAARGQVAALIGSDGRRLAREVAAAAGITLEPGRAEAIDAHCGDLFAALNRAPTLLPGASALLGRLEAIGMPWAIATSSRREQVGVSIEALKLARRPTIVDGSQVENAKPAPDLLLAAATKLGVEPLRSWYVGDSIWDVQAALAAGMQAIGVASGSATTGDLEEAGAQLIVDELSELIPLVR